MPEDDHKPILSCAYCSHPIHNDFYKFMFDNTTFPIHPICFESVKAEYRDLLSFGSLVELSQN
jgi:hypothetical protein